MTNTSLHTLPRKTSFGLTLKQQFSAASSVAAVLVARALSPAPASALSITQTSGLNVSGESPQVISYQQFDDSLGTLTSVTFSFAGQSTGSFTLTAPNLPSAGYTLQGASVFLAAEWIDGSPEHIVEASADIFSILTTPTNNFNVARNTTKEFTLSSSVNSSSGTIAYNNFYDYFTGSGSVSVGISQILSYSGINSSTANFSSLLYGGEGSYATLTYTYDAIPVPAPVPVVSAITGFAFLRRQRRRLNATK